MRGRVGRPSAALNPVLMCLGAWNRMTRSFFSATVVLVLAFAGLGASIASAEVSAHVYLTDEMTPLPLADPNVPDVYRDIMVGTRLTIFISSDTTERWSGSLWLSNDDAANGSLAGRDCNPANPTSYEGSCLEAAGPYAQVRDISTPSGVGLNLLCTWGATIGDWFVLDYRATGVGACCIGLYDETVHGDPNGVRYPERPGPVPEIPFDLIQVLCFNHVVSRDFSGDAVVNFVDFAILANRWMDLADVDAPVSHDLDADGVIASSDIALFSEYWLERTEVLPVVSGPIEPNAVP